MKKGTITMAVPEESWLWPYIGYTVWFDEKQFKIEGAEHGGSLYPIEYYIKHNYIKETNHWDKITSEIFA